MVAKRVAKRSSSAPATEKIMVDGRLVEVPPPTAAARRKKETVEQLAATDPPLVLVFTGEATGGTLYTWDGGMRRLERGGGVLVNEWPLPDHFVALIAVGDAYLQPADLS